jgi:hypothetical protein
MAVLSKPAKKLLWALKAAAVMYFGHFTFSDDPVGLSDIGVQ